MTVVAETVVVYQPVRIQGAPRFLVACSRCGYGYPVAQRTLNEFRRKLREPVCPECRRSEARRVVVTPELLQWWLDRFSAEECVEMGEALKFLADRIGGPSRAAA